MSDNLTSICEGKNPPTFNLLSAKGFKFVLNRIPTVSFFVTKANIPSLTSKSANAPTQFKNLPNTADRLTYEPLTISFKVDEDLNNYIEILDWLKGITFPKDYAQFRGQQKPKVVSDGSLIITTSAFKPNIEFKFTNLFPITLSGWDMDTSLTDVKYIDCLATFEYDDFEVQVIK